MAYTRAAVERAMKVQEAILQALSGRQSWLQVADVLGVSPRTVRRLRWRYERYGYDGLVDHRRRRPSPRAVPLAEVQRLLRAVPGAVRAARRPPGLQRPALLPGRAAATTACACRYSFVKQALQTAGLVGKRRPRGPASPAPRAAPVLRGTAAPRWQPAPVAGVGADARQTLIAVVDDATKRLLYAQLVAGGESMAAIMTALRAVLETHGIPGALYTDRAGWAVYTPTSGSAPDRTKRTQVGRALARLGIEHIVSFSPQARGRSERANGTLQGRLVNELRVAGIRTLAAANRVSARALHRRLQRALCPRPGRSQQCLRARGAAAGPRPDPLPRGRALRGAGQHPRARRRGAADRQTAGPAQLCRPARARSSPSRRAAFGLVGAPLPGVVYRHRPARPGARGVSPNQERSDHVSNASGQITCQ